MRKIIFSSIVFISSITYVFGQYSRTWTQQVETTANRFKLLYENNDPGNNYLEEYNYSLSGPSYNSVTSFYWLNGEWYIRNEEGFNIEKDISFHITRAGINETAFAHGVTTENIDADGYRTYINHPDLNGNPDAIFLYSHLNSVGGGNDKITGLQYYNGKWTIYNQDLKSLIPLGSDYFIIIPGNPQLTFIHTTSDSLLNYSVIDHPDLNGNPNAKLFVSHNLTESNNVFNKNIGVNYWPFIERWSIVTGDLSPIPNGQAFNVMIPDGDLDNIPDYADRCTGFDDSLDRDHDGDPDYCEGYLGEICDNVKTIYEDHLPGEILNYQAQFSITSDRKINSTAQISFYSDNHNLKRNFEVADGATFEAHGTYCEFEN